MLLEGDNGRNSASRIEFGEDRSPAEQLGRTNRHLNDALLLRPLLTRVIHHVTRSGQETDDLLQEAYLRILLWMRKGDHAELRNFQAFAVRVARNLALDWARQKKSRWFEYSAAPEDDEVADVDSDVSYLVDAENELDRLVAVVGRLPARRRQVFTLRKIYGMSQKEIANALHITENTVEQHLAKAARGVGRYQREALGSRDTISVGNPFKRRRRPKAA
ncbi:MAG: RNA polymerase sigma factor [Gammaproteobacteria bacterium]